MSRRGESKQEELSGPGLQATGHRPHHAALPVLVRPTTTVIFIALANGPVSTKTVGVLEGLFRLSLSVRKGGNVQNGKRTEHAFNVDWTLASFVNFMQLYCAFCLCNPMLPVHNIHYFRAKKII